MTADGGQTCLLLSLWVTGSVLAPARLGVPYTMTKPDRSREVLRSCTAQHGITQTGLELLAGSGLVEAKGVFEGDRIAGRVVKYVDPGKSTKGESSHQGHTR